MEKTANPFASLIEQEYFNVPSFALESGHVLREVPVAYKTWGKLNDTKDNVMVICHAFTGSSAVEDWCVTIDYFATRFEDIQMKSRVLGGDPSWARARRSTRDDISYSAQT